jgi:hypothetical protein
MKRPLPLVVLLAFCAPLAVAQNVLPASHGDGSVVLVAASTSGHFAAADVLAALNQVEGDHISVSVFPNPAYESTTVQFQLERPQRFVLDVFDLLGRRVVQQELGELEAGEHEVTLRLRNLSHGRYIVRLTGDSGARATVRLTVATAV